jgi:hypothetical protein
MIQGNQAQLHSKKTQLSSAMVRPTMLGNNITNQLKLKPPNTPRGWPPEGDYHCDPLSAS